MPEAPSVFAASCSTGSMPRIAAMQFRIMKGRQMIAWAMTIWPMPRSIPVEADQHQQRDAEHHRRKHDRKTEQFLERSRAREAGSAPGHRRRARRR